jgi:hypothetical protein
MPEQATKWQPIADIDSPFGSISYQFRHDSLSVQMIGVRTLVLEFTGVVALRFEQECPGFDFFPQPLPMLRPLQTFPLLCVEGSSWREQYATIYGDLRHFALVSSDHLLQLLAKPDVKAAWTLSYDTEPRLAVPIA